MLSILTQFLYQIDHRTLWWTVVGVNWLTASIVPQDSVWGPLMFLLYTWELLSIMENKRSVMTMTPL